MSGSKVCFKWRAHLGSPTRLPVVLTSSLTTAAMRCPGTLQAGYGHEDVESSCPIENSICTQPVSLKQHHRRQHGSSSEKIGYSHRLTHQSPEAPADVIAVRPTLLYDQSKPPLCMRRTTHVNALLPASAICRRNSGVLSSSFRKL